MVKSVGAALGLFAFAVTAIMGLAAGNPAQIILLRAIWAMVIFSLIGMVTGWIASRILDEHMLKKEQELFADTPDQANPAVPPAAPAAETANQG